MIFGLQGRPIFIRVNLWSDTDKSHVVSDEKQEDKSESRSLIHPKR